ncbi:MAG: glycosyltransferase family 2 protein [Prevotella sp.]|nr:glycosyltransferase family 2 protein [Prevotella sp.]
MKFSFVLPAYKGTYLQQALQSILSQTYSDFELIVVDDCSPEDIRSIAASFSDERLSYHRNDENIGGKNLVAQWNKCLEYANGDYVVLATDDDLYEPHFLSYFVPLIEKYPSVDIFRARTLQVNSDNEITAIDRCYKEYLSSVEFYYHMLHGMKGGIPQYIFKRESLIRKGGFVDFPKAWASDDATALMMSENGVATSQEHLVRFRNSGINISSDTSIYVEKTKARLMFAEWLRKNIPEIEINDEFGRFYRKEVYDHLPIYNKTTLISTMKNLTMSQKVRCLTEVVRSKIFNKKDILSISYHTIM